MWVLIKKKFRDKHTGKIYTPGQKMNLSKERVEEILRVGELVEPVKKDKESEE